MHSMSARQHSVTVGQFTNTFLTPICVYQLSRYCEVDLVKIHITLRYCDFWLHAHHASFSALRLR